MKREKQSEFERSFSTTIRNNWSKIGSSNFSDDRLCTVRRAIVDVRKNLSRSLPTAEYCSSTGSRELETCNSLRDKTKMTGVEKRNVTEMKKKKVSRSLDGRKSLRVLPWCLGRASAACFVRGSFPPSFSSFDSTVAKI